MYGEALGVIETIGLTPAAAALDAATDTADVECIGVEKVIGVGKVVSVTLNLSGQVAAVQAAVEAGVEEAKKVGTVISWHVIPRPHGDVAKLVGSFKKEPSKGNDDQAVEPVKVEEPAKPAKTTPSKKADQADNE